MRRLAYPVLAAIALLGVDLRDARACSPPDRLSPSELRTTFGQHAPKDGALPFIVGSDVDPSYRVDATDATGTAVPLLIEDSIEPGTKILRAKNGELPIGKLHIIFTHRPKATAGSSPEDVEPTNTIADVEISAEKIADFEPVIFDMKVVAITMPDESSPKVICHHTVKHSPGDCSSQSEGETQEVTEIPSRVKKVPQVTFNSVQPAWSPMLTTRARYTTKLANGAVSRTEGGAPGQPGVEYCVEVETSPRYIAGTTKTTSRCIPNGDLGFDVTSSDHDDALTSSSRSYDCNSLDFPDGVHVPEALENKSQGGDRGCSTTPGNTNVRGTTLALLGIMLFVLAVLARRRRLA